MKLNEGGNIFKDPETKQPVTQRINREDVDTTLAWLEKITNLPHRDFKLGTTGRKDTSGDLDIAINANDVTKDEMVAKLAAWLQKNKPNENPKDWIRKSGISVHFKTPINGDEANGYVQTDLMFGEPDWMKWSLRGASGNSPYGGKERQILMASISTAQGFKWSPNTGLVDRATNEIVSTDPAEIAQKLLGPTAQIDDLESVETIITKAKTLPNYEQLVADARETFSKMDLVLPESLEDKQLGRIKELSGMLLNSVKMYS
jgi:hypothetical protein